MKIAIYGSRHQSGYIGYIADLVGELHKRGIEVLMAEKLFVHMAQNLPSAPEVDSVVGNSQISQYADLAFSIGGDGTFLRTAQWVAPYEIPVFGINTGHLGYLSDHRMARDFNWIDSLIAGDYSVEPRTMLKVESPTLRSENGFWPHALNEVAVLKKDTASMIDIEAYVDGVFLANYRADGLIVATPTGSTGYNLSVGGPILQPTAPVNVISPIAAHSLSMRPLVISNDAEVQLVTTSRAGSFRLTHEGRSLSINEVEPIVISPSFVTTKIVIRPEHNFADTLRQKLYWGVLNVK